jgi:hypothetical protein
VGPNQRDLAADSRSLCCISKTFGSRRLYGTSVIRTDLRESEEHRLLTVLSTSSDGGASWNTVSTRMVINDPLDLKFSR